MNTPHDQLHEAQRMILRALLFTPRARFSELNTTGLTNDHFTFHLKAILAAGWAQKTEEGLYELTVPGKEFANRFDVDGREVKIERQAKVAVAVLPVRGPAGNKREYLVNERLKQPFFGHWGVITGKMKWGETVAEAALRELDEEAGLTGTPSLALIEHKMDYDLAGNLLEDKFFHAVRMDDTRGSLKDRYEGGRNVWMRRSEIEALEKRFEGLSRVLDLIESDAPFQFIEWKCRVGEY